MLLWKTLPFRLRFHRSSEYWLSFWFMIINIISFEVSPNFSSGRYRVGRNSCPIFSFRPRKVFWTGAVESNLDWIEVIFNSNSKKLQILNLKIDLWGCFAQREGGLRFGLFPFWLSRPRHFHAASTPPSTCRPIKPKNCSSFKNEMNVNYIISWLTWVVLSRSNSDILICHSTWSHAPPLWDPPSPQNLFY